MSLAEMIYRVTGGFPKQEEYRLTSQLIRAAISVPANIAEGQRRGSRKDYARFIGIARGSIAEVEKFLDLAKRLSFAPTEQIAAAEMEADEVSRMLNVMQRKLSDER